MSAAAQARAETAASDAARDARAEILNLPEEERVSGVSKAISEEATRDGYYHFITDIWITDLNTTEFGIYKHQRNRAKSRQFTSDMDIFAEIKEGGERIGLIGYREDLWEKQEGMDKRLVFKLFSDTLNWRATMDLMLGRSLQQTVASRGLPVWTFSINTNEDHFIIYLERSANKWSFLPENFGFFIVRDGTPYFYRLKRDLIDLGGDFTIYDQHDQKIGHLDGKVFSIGGKWKGRILREHAERRLLTVLQMFSAMQVFNPQIRRHMRRLWKDVRSNNIVPKIDRHEADLYMNPRRIR